MLKTILNIYKCLSKTTIIVCHQNKAKVKGEKTLNVDVKYEISNSYCLALQQVLEFFSYLTSILGNNIQIIFKPTPHEGVNAGLQWKFGKQPPCHDHNKEISYA